MVDSNKGYKGFDKDLKCSSNSSMVDSNACSAATNTGAYSGSNSSMVDSNIAEAVRDEVLAGFKFLYGR